MIRIIAAIMGHPWDIWGLSQIFDGREALKIKVEAVKPR
jgi:hypothetical protein